MKPSSVPHTSSSVAAVPYRGQESLNSSRALRLKRFVTLSGIVLILIGLWQQQAIADQIKLIGYTPSSTVVALANDDGMSTTARRIFYVNHPSVLDRSAFNTACTSHGEQSIVLGCYHPIDGGIFVFDVSDQRLHGVEEVTAAHEMLHAAYDRLGSSEKSSIDQELQNYYNFKLKDSRIKATIAAYTKTEPNDVINEMHSIFGTEVKGLPDTLERYYSKYFTDRQKVVDYADSYTSEFTSRQQEVAAYDARLKTIGMQIDTNKTTIESQGTELDQLRVRMDAYRNDDAIAAYNQLVPSYNASVQSYNQLVADTRTMIATYNAIVADRNTIAIQVTDLAHSIDSNFGQTK